MERSESIANLASALLEFNKEVPKIDKDRKNEFVGNMYSTLDNIIEVVRPILTKHGLAVMQFGGAENGEVSIRTMLLHKSGEWMMSPVMSLKPVKDNPQAAGSALTYLRRYSLNAFLSLNTGEDDDANGASGKVETTPERPVERPTTSTSTRKPNEERPASAPVEKPSTDSTGTDKPASDKQLGAIKSVARSKGKDPEWIEEQCQKKFGKPLDSLSRNEASSMIDALRAYTPKAT